MAAQLKVVGLNGDSVNTDRQKALEAALAQIDRAFGKGSAMKLGSREKIEIDTISTVRSGSISRSASAACRAAGSSKSTVRKAPARRRWRCTPSPRRRRLAEPPPSSTPNMLDPGYAKKLGVDIDELIVSQPDTGEQALEIVDTLVRSNAIDVLVVDSVAALVPRAEIEGEMGDSHVGLRPA